MSFNHDGCHLWCQGRSELLYSIGGCVELPLEPGRWGRAASVRRVREGMGLAPAPGQVSAGKNRFGAPDDTGEREKGQSWRRKGQAELWGLKRCHAGETFFRPGSRSGA